MVVVYAADPELPEPTDKSGKAHVRRSELIGPNADVVVIWREYGDDFAGGVRTNVAASGVFSNVTEDAIREAVTRLLAL